MPSPLVALVSTDADFCALADAIAKDIGGRRIAAPADVASPAGRKTWLQGLNEPAVILLHDGVRWSLVDGASPASEPVVTGGDRGVVSRSEPLGRALGVHKRKPADTSVLDATGGLGRDALQMSRWGCDVSMIERSLALAVLLQDNVEMPEVTIGDAVDELAKLTDEQRPHVVYLDPMHPPRQNSARVKHDLAVLGRLLGEREHDPAAESRLLTAARNAARTRVVVKRPPHADSLDDTAPSHRVNGTRVRFDVYLT